MAYRNIMHSCGHRERISIDGPYRVVDARVKRIEHSRCAMCIANDPATTDHDGFRPLWGNDPILKGKAELIRRRTLEQARGLARHATSVNERDAYRYLESRILRIGDPAWWCEHPTDAIQVLARDVQLCD